MSSKYNLTVVQDCYSDDQCLYGIYDEGGSFEDWVEIEWPKNWKKPATQDFVESLGLGFRYE